MPNVGGIVETALYVEDMQRSCDFYKRVVGLQVSGTSDRISALQITPNQMLLLFAKGASAQPTIMPYGTIPPTDGSGRLHLALSISAGQVQEWIAWLGDHGVTVESRITWPTGGESLYFRDPDEHLIELKTSNWHGTEFRW